MRKHKGLWSIIGIALLVCAFAPGLQAEVVYREYMVTRKDRVNRNKVIVPQSERLCVLGYLGGSKPKMVNDEQGAEIPSLHYAAMNFFAQVMGMEYHDGTMSVPVQEALASTDAIRCPVSTPGYDTVPLFDIKEKDIKGGEYVYVHVRIIDMKLDGDRYEIIGEYAKSGSVKSLVRFEYDKPPIAPELLIGDNVVVLGKLVVGDGQDSLRTVDADLVAFAAND